jgi:hypothetical protein
MKLTSYSGADSRKDRAERLRRGRAGSVQLRSAFPDVQQLRLELQFADVSPAIPAAQCHVLHPPARAYFTFPCPYADCDGQLDLTQAVNAALDDPAHEAIGVVECAGVRLRKHPSKESCSLKMTYFVTATY